MSVKQVHLARSVSLEGILPACSNEDKWEVYASVSDLIAAEIIHSLDVEVVELAALLDVGKTIGYALWRFAEI